MTTTKSRRGSVRAGRLLTMAALALVLVFPAALTVWTAAGSSSRADDLSRADLRYEAWQQVRHELSREQNLVYAYLTIPSADVRASFDATVATVERLLADLRTDAVSPQSVVHLDRARGAHLQFVRATYDMFDAADKRAMDRVTVIAATEAAPAYGRTTQAVAAGGAVNRGVVATTLTGLRKIQTTAKFAALVAFSAGVALLAGCWLLIVGYQRRVEQQSAASRHQALHDALTGLPNRTLLLDRTQQAIRSTSRLGVPAALLLIDLDRFKEVNDTLGHHCGDLLLQQVGQRLRGVLRDSDTVARLGGDEFAVLLPQTTGVEAAAGVAEKLRAALEEPFTIEGLTLDVEASVGVAAYPDHADDADGLLQRADVAMYAAKETHAGYVVYDPKLDRHSTRRLSLLGQLRGAIPAGQLVLHYQPKAELSSGRIRGVEALVRWQHPEYGLLGPAEFIPLAESTGLIRPLTSYVLDEALRQCREWLDAGHELAVAVNLSTRCLLDTGLPAEIEQLLATWRVPPGQLVVEITESAIMTDPARALHVLTDLHELGVQLAIDDFGTGYSSMAYLKSLPVHELKVDRSFVMSMRGNASDRVIVRSTVDLGHNLGLQVVAEGVEDAETWAELADLGCDTVQGYYLGKPMPSDELYCWLARTQPVAALD